MKQWNDNDNTNDSKSSGQDKTTSTNTNANDKTIDIENLKKEAKTLYELSKVYKRERFSRDETEV